MTVSRDEEVLGLQIPMDDALLMRGGEALRDLQRVVHGLLLRNRTGVELPAQGLAFQKLHDGIRDAVLVSEVVRSQGCSGCESAATAFASRSNRASVSGSAATY